MTEKKVLAGDTAYVWETQDAPLHVPFFGSSAKQVVTDRAAKGWLLFSKQPSLRGEDRVLLTFYKAK